MRLKVFFIEDHIIKKNDVNRTTLREVLRFLSQNLSKISLSKDNTKILQTKKIPDLPTRFCRPMKSESHIFIFFCLISHYLSLPFP